MAVAAGFPRGFALLAVPPAMWRCRCGARSQTIPRWGKKGTLRIRSDCTLTDMGAAAQCATASTVAHRLHGRDCA
eukprot:3771608-Alexandrium_andersonii.AAC.1